MKNQLLKYINENHLLNRDSKILLAISGGIDSICLADLLIKLEYKVVFAHCNFKLRGKESDEDLEFVKNLASNYDVPFYHCSFETKEYSTQNKISIQMAARDLRYKWFENLRREISADYVAVAHILDDRVETFFINILKGTGIRGTISMKCKNDYIIRPLMFASRKDIFDYVKKNKLIYREDSSNYSDKYLRNKIRHKLIPILKEINPSINKTINNDISILTDTFTIYNNVINKVFNETVISYNGGYKILKKDLLQLKPLSIYIYEFLNRFGFSDFDAITKSIAKESGIQFFSKTHKLLIDRDYVIIEKIEEESFSECLIIKASNFIEYPLNISFHIKEEIVSNFNNYSACFDYDKLKFPLKIRKWKNGDKFIPLGMKNYKKISDFFIDIKLDIFEKEKTFLLCSGDEIIWVVGHRIDERFRITAKTKKTYIANLLDN